MIRLLLALSTLVLLQGCSAVKLGYQQLPTLSYWWLDSAVSFNDSQSTRVKEALSQVHQWHRSQELPTYLELLQRGIDLSQGPVQASQVCGVWTDIQTRLDRSMRVMVSQAAPVVTQLGPRQLSHLARHFETKNEAWDKEWLQGSAAERLERRTEKTLERYQSFYGDLTAAQTALIKTQVSQSPWQPEWGRQERLRREQELLTALRKLAQSDMPQEQAEAELWRVWQRWFMPPNETDRMVMQKMSQQACENLTQLHNTTSPEQRQRLTRKLRSYERDIRELMKP
ncbi:MAG: hypothetical protein RLZZ95_594 [Pseudomonadota bacterium]